MSMNNQHLKMNNQTEQIFIVNAPESQLTPEVQKLGEASLSTQDIENFSTVCRTCATVTEFVIPIFDGEGLQNNLADKIHKHLPIQVTEQDVLPRVVCYQCANTLLAWHELVQCCVQADAALRTRLAVAETSKNVSNEVNLESNDVELNQNTEQNEQDKSEAHLSSTLKKILVDCLPTLSSDKENDIQYACQKCSETMINISQLTNHLKSFHLTETTSYSMLQEFVKNHITFEEKLDLEDSERDNDSETEAKHVELLQKYFCPFCESVFSSATRLICHLNQHIDMSFDDGVTCCDETYHSKKTFVKHLQDRHINRVLDATVAVCLSCGFEADDRNSLQVHITEMHVTGKASSMRTSKELSNKNQKAIPAVCPECNKTFSNKYNMFVHMKTHSEASTKFSCDKCNKCYSNRGNLTYHKKIAHEGILNYTCNTCGEAFPSRHARDNHARIHTGYTPYECHYCHKAFRAKNTLDRHIEMHLDIRKYECHICSKKFRKRTHLNYHLGTHKVES